ncbi:MAG TPA: ABC transporter ATP-binding protein [Frankiaceae bacterium]|nr:ABC transporter ATP-binding protein [Frankiaceae bacterium]
MTALRTEGLTKRYRRTVAVDGLDLEAAGGEVFGFVGANGAGKTTTIRMLVGLVRPTSGRATVLGRDVTSAAVRAEVGYVPGDPGLYPRLTARETLAYLARLRGGVPVRDVEAFVDRLGLDPTRRVGELSRGNRQKVALVQAFMHRPRVLLLDEPTSGLDPLVQREFRLMVREAAADGALVFLSSHDLDEVQRLADRAAVIARGRVVAVEDVPELERRAQRHVEVVFAGDVPAGLLAGVPGVGDVTIDGRVVGCTVAGPPGPLLRALGELDVVSLTSRAPDLEDVFLRDYRQEDERVPA